VVVAVFPSLEGEDLEDFSIRLAQRWRVGRKGLDDGVIILVFVRDRRVRMEVGYGLEGAVPDAVAGRIIREIIAPAFRERRWAAGLEAAADALFAGIRGGDGWVGRRPAAPRSTAWMPWVALGLVVVVLAGLALAAHGTGRHLRRGRRVYTAGPDGWYLPPPPVWHSGGWGGRGFSGGGDGFSGGGGEFGGGGASGEW